MALTWNTFHFKPSCLGALDLVLKLLGFGKTSLMPFVKELPCLFLDLIDFAVREACLAI